MDIDKVRTGMRLKKFLYSNFTSLAEAADYLNTTPGSLRNSYFNGKSYPGAEIISKLMHKGCDINWLLHGRKKDEKPEQPLPMEFRVEAIVPAGKDREVVDVTEWWQTEVIDFRPDDHVFIQVDEQFGYSMMPLIAPGDLVLISFSQKPKDGDLVAARWDNTKGAVKILVENPQHQNLVVLTSYNQAVQPIFLARNQVKMYKIVLIKKKK
jgi:phage repressor protein C with HTH and peptisase S24 domain